MGNDHGPGEPCCDTCKLGELTARGEVAFESSPFLIVGDGDTEMILHVRREVTRLPLHRGQRFVVGRSADVIVDHPFASRRIFSLEVTAAGFVLIEDVGSTCGTYVNEERVERHQLRAKDAIKVGGGWMLFHQGEHLGRPTAIEHAWTQPPQPLPAGFLTDPNAPFPAPPVSDATSLPPPHSLSLWRRILSLLG